MLARVLATVDICDAPPTCYEDHRATQEHVEELAEASQQPGASAHVSVGWGRAAGLPDPQRGE
jgi:hypothetical protein